MRPYLLTWLVLSLLTALTWGAASAHLGAWSVLVALAIAIFKASLVGLIFMHLRHEPASSRLVIVGALALLAVLCSLTLVDVSTRGS